MGSAAKYFHVEAPVEQVYAYWRDFSHFPAFMPDVEEVHITAAPPRQERGTRCRRGRCQ